MSCCNDWTKITNIGAEHVVVEIRDLHELLRRSGTKLSKQLLGELERCGRFAVADLHTWQVILCMVCDALRRRRVGDGECNDFCSEACEEDDGCDEAGGTAGECVAVCRNGEVYLQNPAV